MKKKISSFSRETTTLLFADHTVLLCLFLGRIRDILHVNLVLSVDSLLTDLHISCILKISHTNLINGRTFLILKGLFFSLSPSLLVDETLTSSSPSFNSALDGSPQGIGNLPYSSLRCSCYVNSCRWFGSLYLPSCCAKCIRKGWEEDTKRRESGRGKEERDDERKASFILSF